MVASLKLTAYLPQKMDGWKMNFLLRWPIYRGELAVSFRGVSLLNLEGPTVGYLQIGWIQG